MDLKANNTKSVHQIISNIQNCVVDVKSLIMAANMWQMDVDKTKVLIN